MTNYLPCPKCGCEIGKSLQHCPYCGAYAGAPEPSFISYPTVNHNKLKLRQLVPNIIKLLIIANLIVIIVNIFTVWGRPLSVSNLWCLYPLASSLFMYVVLLYPLSIREFYWKEVIFHVLTTIAFLILIDFFANSAPSWSLIYVVPWYLAAVNIAMAVTMLIRKTNIGNMLLVMLIFLLLSIANLVLGLTVFRQTVGHYDIIWNFISFLICLSVSASFSLIKRNELIRMWKRTFHI